jgi:peptidoglycan/LPS O-acetylase OafA/YrhL
MFFAARICHQPRAMGIFRFLLAASVVVAHSSRIPGIYLLDAGLAVKTFFLISGFYMQLILDTKYGRVANGTQLFYTNRALRIYPMYLLTLLFALLFYAAACIKLGHPVDRVLFWVQAYRLGDFGPLALIALSQFTVFGLDVTPLFSFSPTAGFHLLTQPIPPDGGLAWRLNFLPHCWSIGAELLFYTFAPLFNYCRTWLLVVGALAFSTACLVAHLVAPDFSGPLDYHFGPMQFGYFLLGMLAYRLVYKQVLHRKTRLDWRLYVPIVLAAALTFNPCWVPYAVSELTHVELAIVYLILAAMCVPILFHLTKVAAWDRWIGELSYPMYLLHIPLKWVLLAKAGVSQKDTAIVSGAALLALTVAVALAMTYFVDRPIEKLRRERFEKEARN